MMTNDDIGRRIADLRARRGLTQEELAEFSGVSISVIRKVEQGRGGARMESFHAIARALDVVTMMFVPSATRAPDPIEHEDVRDLILADLRAAVLPAVALADSDTVEDLCSEAPDLQRLRKATRSLVDAYHGNRYDFVAQIAPGLIRSAHLHVATAPHGQIDDAVFLRADLFKMVARYLVQVRENDLAFIVLRSALEDARRVGNQPLAAMIIGSCSRIMLRQTRFDQAERMVVKLADEIEPKVSTATPNQLAAWGRSLLWASAAASRNNRPQEARDYLAAAASAAARLGSEQMDLVGHESFGPLTVATKGPENEMIAGNPGRVLELSNELPRGVGKMTPAGWQQHLLYRAHAFVLMGKVHEATNVLSGLRRTASEWLRQQRLSREVTQDLISSCKGTVNEEQMQLANFLGVPV